MAQETIKQLLSKFPKQSTLDAALVLGAKKERAGIVLELAKLKEKWLEIEDSYRINDAPLDADICKHVVTDLQILIDNLMLTR